jgi:hypothetical protein
MTAVERAAPFHLRRGLPPPERYAHGTRARYVSAKCRCDLCRKANTAYYHSRQAKARELAAAIAPVAGETPQIWTAPDGTKRERWYKRACPGPGNGVPCPRSSHLRKDSKGGCCRVCRELLVWNGNVWAAPVRAHLGKLSRAGVGYKSVAIAADVAFSIVQGVMSGRKKFVRRATADRIMAVTKDAMADHALVDAGPTWKRIHELLEIGMTKGAIARHLGCGRAALQIRRGKVLARTALAVRRLHTRVMAEPHEMLILDAGDPRYIDATEAKRLLARIQRVGGLTMAAVAERLGVTRVQIKARCTVQTLKKLRALEAWCSRQAEIDRRAAHYRTIEEGAAA